MKKNIFSPAKKLNEIFKDESFLYPEFVPEKLPHREKEIDEMVFAFKPLTQKRKASNLLLLGKSGTGKTVTAKYVLKELSEFTEKAKSIYINCFEFSSRTAILSNICNFLGSPVPRRGWATDEIYSEILQALKRISFTPVIVLDEIDQLLKNESASKLLYDLLRVIEFEKSPFVLVLISNNFSFTTFLDPRVKSSLAAKTISFEQYSPQQLKDILRERAEKAFFQGVLEREVINVSAAHAAKLGGDARIAIESLLKAGRIAEKENSKKVKLEHLKKAFEEVDLTPLQKILPHLKREEKEILSLLLSFKEINSGKLFEELKEQKRTQISQRHFSNLISNLESFHLINAPIIKKGIKGRTRMISLKVSKNALKEALSKEKN